MQDQTSLSLLESLRNADERSWQRFADLYTPLVYAWCRQAGLESSDSADIVQEVFWAVHRNITRFSKAKPGDTFRGWLWSVTRNKIRDHFRARGITPPLSGGSTAQAIVDSAPDEEPLTMSSIQQDKRHTLLARAVRMVESEFEAKTWKAFWQSKIEEIPTVEVASALGMSQGAVRKARFRILSRLREELGELF